MRLPADVAPICMAIYLRRSAALDVSGAGKWGKPRTVCGPTGFIIYGGCARRRESRVQSFGATEIVFISDMDSCSFLVNSFATFRRFLCEEHLWFEDSSFRPGLL